MYYAANTLIFELDSCIIYVILPVSIAEVERSEETQLHRKQVVLNKHS